jgi:hypothetical protein
MYTHELSDRAQLIHTLQYVLAGGMTYSDYSALGLDDSDDVAVSRIWDELDDLLIDDLHPSRLLEPDSTTQELIARCILFLQSNVEYQWPRSPATPQYWVVIVLALVAIGVTCLVLSERDYCVLFGVAVIGFASIAMMTLRTRFQVQLKRWQNAGTIEVWPFLRGEDYEAARMKSESVQL